MKKFRGFGVVALSSLAAFSMLLASCNNKTTNKKAVYGLNEKEEVAKLSDCEVLFKENSNIPYIPLNECTEIMTSIRQSALKDSKYKYELNKVGNNYVISNEKGAKCTIDKNNQTLKYDDFDNFTAFVTEGQNPLLIMPATGKNYKPIKIVSSDYKPGKEVEISLKNYSKLDIYEANDKFYLPISVFNSTLLNCGSSVNLAYNGESLFLLAGNQLINNTLGIPFETELGQKFREGVAKETITKEELEYYYQSLCFDFNYQYGLKEKFADFDQFIQTYNYKEKIMNTNLKEIDANTAYALSWLNDGHTALSDFTHFYEYGTSTVDSKKLNPVAQFQSESDASFTKAKKEKNITDGIEYSGDTAFITFTNFDPLDENLLYLNNDENISGIKESTGIDLEDISKVVGYNTAQLFNKLYKEITSDEYKYTIKNVVVDLSTNDGGSADSLIYSLSTLIGNVTVDMDNPLSGAHNKQIYKADINADEKIDEKDISLAELGFNIYFLNSSYSFSSANAMPYIAKLNNPNVITLGAKTAGGPCAVRTYVSTIGNVISSSSLNTITKNVNGKYQNIDDGIEADFKLTEDQMIDRKYIVENINNWKLK